MRFHTEIIIKLQTLISWNFWGHFAVLGTQFSTLDSFGEFLGLAYFMLNVPLCASL